MRLPMPRRAPRKGAFEKMAGPGFRKGAGGPGRAPARGELEREGLEENAGGKVDQCRALHEVRRNDPARALVRTLPRSCAASSPAVGPKKVCVNGAPGAQVLALTQTFPILPRGQVLAAGLFFCPATWSTWSSCRRPGPRAVAWDSRSYLPRPY